MAFPAGSHFVATEPAAARTQPRVVEYGFRKLLSCRCLVRLWPIRSARPHLSRHHSLVFARLSDHYFLTPLHPAIAGAKWPMVKYPQLAAAIFAGSDGHRARPEFH